MLCRAGQCLTIKRSVVPCSAVQCSVVIYKKAQCSTVQCKSVHCSKVLVGKVYCGAVKLSVVQRLTYGEAGGGQGYHPSAYGLLFFFPFSFSLMIYEIGLLF